MIFVFSNKLLAKSVETLIRTIYMLVWASPSNDVSYLLCNL